MGNVDRRRLLGRRGAVLWFALGYCVSLAGAQGASIPSVPPLADNAVPPRPQDAAVLGSIQGRVDGPDGALISGAEVSLQAANGSPTRLARTDRDGHFLFAQVPSGPFTVSVTLSGFDPMSAAGYLATGGTLDLKPFSLRVSTVNFTVEAESMQQLAAEEMHAEEKQRLLGVLPNFYVSYSWSAPPLTARQKFNIAWKSVSDPGNLVLVGVTAGVQQATDSFPGYSQGAAGYGRRYGADLGNLVGGVYMGGAILPSLFRQDPRYFYKGTGTVRSRVRYAISRAVICRGDNGKPQPAFASLLGDLSAGAISNLYYAPSDRQGAKLTFENGLLGIAGDAMNDLVQEFVLPRFTTRAKGKPNHP